MFDRMVDDKAALAVLAAWLRTINREDLKRRLLQSPDTTLEQIMEQAKEKIRNQGRSEEEAEDDGLMPSPWGLVRPVMPPEERKAARCFKETLYREQPCRRQVREMPGAARPQFHSLLHQASRLQARRRTAHVWSFRNP